MICTSCFKNFGIKQVSLKLNNTETKQICKNCNNYGYPLNDELINDIMGEFFVRGSIPPEAGGPAPVYQFNSCHSENEVTFLTEIDHDLQLLSKELNVGLFHYGPPLWRLGYTEHYQSLFFDKVVGDERNKIWDEIINSCETRTLTTNDVFFRVRTGNKMPPILDQEFDTPPLNLSCDGRFNSKEFPILYCATDVETCIYETRANLSDYIVVAELQPIKGLKLLDLSNCKRSCGTEFEQVSRMLQRLSFAGKEEYSICQELAMEIKKRDYDGFIADSYFQQAHKSKLQNIILFGYPIKDKKIELKSASRIVINSMSYEFSYGPTNNNNKKIDHKRMKEIYEELISLCDNDQLDSERNSELLNELKAMVNSKSSVPI